jgi:hypothetical protein
MTFLVQAAYISEVELFFPDEAEVGNFHAGVDVYLR